MKIFLNCGNISRLVEIKELKVFDFVKTREFYLANKELFLEKYTDLNKLEINDLSNDTENLTKLINYFVSINNLEEKYLVEKTMSEFDILNNTFTGFFIYDLLKKNYSINDLKEKTYKELFMLFLMENKRYGLDFNNRDTFNLFKDALTENYGQEIANKFFKETNTKIEGNSYSKSEEEIFNEEIKKMNNI